MSKIGYKVTPTECAIMDGLRKYRFLNIPQMEKLGIGKQHGQITHALPKMVKCSHPYIDRIVPGTLPGHGRLPNVYFLTEYGAAVIADILMLDRASVHYPVSVVRTSYQYWHRIHAIDCHIATQQWADANCFNIDYYLDYFEYKGSNRSSTKPNQTPLTRIEHNDQTIVPDAIFQLSNDAGIPYFFALEIYNQSRPSRTFDKIKEYCFAISAKALTKTFDYEFDPRILIIFEHKAALDSHLARVCQIPEVKAYDAYFFHKTLAEVEDNFASGWHRLNAAGTVDLFNVGE